MRAAALLALLAAAWLLPAACGGTDETSAPAQPGTTTVVVTETVPATTTKPKPKPTAPLEDGKHFGYIKSAEVTDAPRELDFDLAYFLTGEEANKEAAKRGSETPVANDYFVVNDNPKLRTLPVADHVVVDLVDWKRRCDKRFAADLERFEAAFASRDAESMRYRGSSTSYWITVEDGLVTRIEEQYLP